MPDGAEAVFARLGMSRTRPQRDASAGSFSDGGMYRVEIPSVEGPRALETVIKTATEAGVPVHRVSQGSGIFMLLDAEIRAMAELGHTHGIEVSLFVGPRAPWEGSAQALTPDGKLLGWRHTNLDQVDYAYRDVERAVDLGIRSVLIADEGLLWVIGQAREMGLLPRDLVVKGSALLGVANPLQVKLLEGIGLDTINIASDTPIDRLAEMRAVLRIPLDLYIESPDSLGGFTRYHEIGEVVRVAAPVYLKFGLRNSPNIYPSGEHLDGVVLASARERVRRAAIGIEHLRRLNPNAECSPLPRADAGVPAR
jgi:hypothetical protein